MNIGYDVGSIISLYENEEKNYCVLSSLKIENDKYLMLQPIEKNAAMKNVEIEKAFIIKLNKSETDFELVNNPDIIKEVIYKTIENGSLSI